MRRIGAFIASEIGRLDILLNNAGMNIADRHWDKLTPENASLMINGNLGMSRSLLNFVERALPGSESKRL